MNTFKPTGRKYSYHKSITDEFTTALLRTGDDEKVKRLFYAMGQ
jgi:hypothetical protein